jgi:uncharacterized protein (TIGR00299 family) protein
MRIAYFDCFSGASGDMITAALLDAGAAVEELQEQIHRLPLQFELRVQRVQRHGLEATQVLVTVDQDQPHRHLTDIIDLLGKAGLDARVNEQAQRIFRRLAQAEAEVHGCDVQDVHFHEVGAGDAIVDVVAACAGLGLLNVDRVVCSPLPVGSGAVACEHGVLPVPAPAVCNLLKGVPLAPSYEDMEMTTPTGAAILTTLADSYGRVPAMTLLATGCGAGQREGSGRPNVLRVLLGTAEDPADIEDIVQLEAAIDDQTPQITGFVIDRLLALGALDAYCQPIVMKKSRPGMLLTVLCRVGTEAALENCLYAETTTFGIRRQVVRRTVLERRIEQVQLSAGCVRIKIGSRRGQVLTATPEFEDCRRIADAAGQPLRQVMSAAMEAWRRKLAGS